MKVSARQYARTLHELVAGRSKEDVIDIITNFVSRLNKDRVLYKAEEIINEFEKLIQADSGEMLVEVKSARPLSNEAKLSLRSYLEKKSGAKKIEMKEELDASLLGGFVVRYDDRVIDGSLKNNLAQFHKQLSN